MRPDEPRFSIVLPCYNEAENLPALLARYAEVWEDLPAELILVDNGSNDETPDVLARELARPEFAFARSVRVEVNQGYGHGIATGLAATRGAVVGFSHADMQCKPDDLFRAYHALEAAPAPALIKGRRAWRGLGPGLITGGMSLLASVVLLAPLTDVNAQPKVFPRALLAGMQAPPTGFEFDLYVLHQARQAGFTIRTIPVVFGDRLHGVSKWAFSFKSRWRTISRVARYILQLRLKGAA